MKMTALLAAVLALAAVQTIRAESVSTQQLMDWCRSKNTNENGFCMGYVLGSAWATQEQILTYKEEDGRINAVAPEIRLGICIPLGVSASQLVAIFLTFTDKYPREWHRPPAIVVAMATAEAFPCTGK